MGPSPLPFDTRGQALHPQSQRQAQPPASILAEAKQQSTIPAPDPAASTLANHMNVSHSQATSAQSPTFNNSQIANAIPTSQSLRPSGDCFNTSAPPPSAATMSSAVAPTPQPTSATSPHSPAVLMAKQSTSNTTSASAMPATSAPLPSLTNPSAPSVASASLAPTSESAPMAFSQGSENVNAVATTSAYTLDSKVPAASSLSPSSKRSPRMTQNPIKQEPLNSSVPPASSPAYPSSLFTPTSANGNGSSASNGTSGTLNEEDAKLLASLADGNGIFAQLSNLSQGQPMPSSSIPDGSASFHPLIKAESLPFDFGIPGFDREALQGAVDLNDELVGDLAEWDDDLVEEEEDDDEGPIQAYAKLEFPGFSYYIQTLDVSIGRRPGQIQPSNSLLGGMPQLPTAALGGSQAHITSESQAEGDVDVDLGPLKSISRLHARIFYYTGPLMQPGPVINSGTPTGSSPMPHRQNESPYRLSSPTALGRLSGNSYSPANGGWEGYVDSPNAARADPSQGLGQFVLSVVGRNGAFVDDVWVEKGGLVVLGKRTKIQIAERVFYFVLPPPPNAPETETAGELKRLMGASDSDSLTELDSQEDHESVDSGDDSGAGEEPESGDEDTGDESSDLSEISDEDDGGEYASTGKPRRPSMKSVDTPGANQAKPKRRLVLKSKARMAAEKEAAESKAVVSLQDQSTSAQMRGRGKGKGAARDKMPKKGPLPEPSEMDMDISDSLGSSEDEEDEGMEQVPQPAGKRPSKGSKAGKGAKGPISPSKKDPSVPSWALGAGIASRKRKRGEGLADDEPALKVGTPIGIEALDAQKRAKAKAASPSKVVSADADDDVIMLDAKLSLQASADGSAASPTKAKSKVTKTKKKKEQSDQPDTATKAPASAQSIAAAATPVPQPGGDASMAVPPAFDLNSASAVSAILSAANAVSGAMPSMSHAPPGSAASGIPPAAAVATPTLASAGAAKAEKKPAAKKKDAKKQSETPALPVGSNSQAGPTPIAPAIQPSVVPSFPSAFGHASPAPILPAMGSVGQALPAAAMPSAVPKIGIAPMPQQPAGPPKPPPGPEDKPDLSNVELISHALRSEHCTKKGGKLTLQEVYEWISNRWIWFKRNGRHTGRDWQSSVRHAIGSSRNFTRIPRRSDEPGKGIFYCMSESELAKKHRENLAKQKEEAAKAAAPTIGQAAGGPNGAAATAAQGKAVAAAAAILAVKIPLVIGIPPAAAGAPPPSDKPKAAPGTIESLLETPPIVHHDGKLFLSPQVFGHLNAGQLAHIEGLGAQQALQVLQAYLVSHLKERMRLQQLAAAQKKDGTSTSPAPAPGPAAAASSSTPVKALATATFAASTAAPTAADPTKPLALAPQPAAATAPAPPKVAMPVSVPSTLTPPVPAVSAPAASKPVTTSAPTVAAVKPIDATAATPAPSTTSAPSAALPAIASKAASPALPGTDSKSASSAPASDPLSALSALAAHPEAAGLIALLKKQQQGGGSQLAKLTPSQLQLLQMANKLAAQQKKAKKKKAKKEGTPAGAAEASGSKAQPP